MTSTFVDALYQDVLHRAADPGGEAFYNNLLATGTTPMAVATLFWQSAEHRGIEVDAFYQAILNRPSDPTGRQVWVTNMLNGMSEETVIAGFLTSTEFLQANPPQTQFIAGVYQTMLNRAPDPAGVSSWLAVLAARPGTTPGPLSSVDEAYVTGAQRLRVAQAIVNSDERNRILVESFYSDYLHRPADPDGENSWVQQLDTSVATDAVVAETFLSSSEYIGAHPII